MVITKKEFDWIKNQKPGSKFTWVIDLGLTLIEALRQEDKVILPGNITLSLDEKIKDNFCYLIDNEGVKPIAFFCDQANRFYKLTPTADWPTLSIGSVPMHKLQSPKQDTHNKLRLVQAYGLVLDTCLGLGYTAIGASHSAKKVITFEKDENSFLLAQINPWSQELFNNSRIEVRLSDVYTGIESFPDNYFDCIIHDPPTFKLAVQLYELKFYQQLYRVLRESGCLFHYTPLYKVSRGYNFPEQIRIKLKKAGFTNIEFSQQAMGFLCRR